MARYYEEATLIEFVKQYTPHINGETTMECVERAICEAPAADVVEVVRCKECEYGSSEDYKNLYTCGNYPDGIGGYVDGNCFCSYGKRRDT